MNVRKFAVVVVVAMAVLMLASALALAGCSTGGNAASEAASSVEASSTASSAASSSSEGGAGPSASGAAASDESGSAQAVGASSAAVSEGSYTLVTPGKLTVATAPYLPPFESLADGEFTGIDIEIAKAIADKLGLEVEFKELQFDAIIPIIAAGDMVDIGISAFTVNAERAKDVDFSDSYFVDGQAIAVMKGGAITEKNADKTLNAKGTVIAVQSGTTGASYVKEHYPEARVQPYSNFIAAFADMQAGRIDAACANKAVVEKLIADSYQDAEIVKSIPTGEEYAIAVSKDNPALTDAINAALDELGADGVVDKIVDANLP